MDNTVTRYQPQTNLARLPDLVDRLFKESFVMPAFWDQSPGSSARPSLPVNLFETADSYVLHVAVPGLKPDNLDVQVVGGEIAIKGHIEVATPESGSWIWRGIPSGDFYQTFTLPVDVDGDKAQASYDYGILTIGLPKAEHVRPKNIKIATNT